MQTVSVVTGGAGGMGLATAKLLGRNSHVVLSDLKEGPLEAAVRELRALDISCTPVTCDITDRASVDALAQAAAELGTIVSVVHAAGVSPQMGDASFIVRVNALGTVLVTEAFLKRAHPRMALVNVSSVAGHMLPALMTPTRTFKLALEGDLPRFEEKLGALASFGPKGMRPGSAYSLSKCFVIWYSKQMAARFGEKGARILSVSPGSFDTEMGRLEEKSGAGRLIEFAALKRFGKPEEIASLLAYCAGEGPGYLTGTDILCDGGTLAGLDLKGMLKMARAAG